MVVKICKDCNRNEKKIKLMDKRRICEECYSKRRHEYYIKNPDKFISKKNKTKQIEVKEEVKVENNQNE